MIITYVEMKLSNSTDSEFSWTVNGAAVEMIICTSISSTDAYGLNSVNTYIWIAFVVQLVLRINKLFARNAVTYLLIDGSSV